jgi:hypothetical protein
VTPKFDKLISEILESFKLKETPKSRYGEPGKAGLSSVVRLMRNLNNKSSSQRTKLGNQQYVGNGVSTIRGKNRSKKSADEISIANGIGGHLKIDGINPKEIGASVNSKQDMEIKNVLPNGSYRIGPRHQTQFRYTKKPHADKFNESYSENDVGIVPYISRGFFKDFNGGHITAGMILHNDTLYENFPYLENIEIILSDSLLSDVFCRYIGTGDVSDGQVIINAKVFRDILKDSGDKDPDELNQLEFLIVHELCHAMQEYENRLDGSQENEDEANLFARTFTGQ